MPKESGREEGGAYALISALTAAELLLWTWGCFLGESGDKSRVAGADRVSAWVFLRRKALADLCCGSPSGRVVREGC